MDSLKAELGESQTQCFLRLYTQSQCRKHSYHLLHKWKSLKHNAQCSGRVVSLYVWEYKFNSQNCINKTHYYPLQILVNS